MKDSRPIIVTSGADPASLNIAQTLISQHGFAETSQHPIPTYSNGYINLVVIEKECIC